MYCLSAKNVAIRAPINIFLLLLLLSQPIDEFVYFERLQALTATAHAGAPVVATPVRVKPSMVGRLEACCKLVDFMLYMILEGRDLNDIMHCMIDGMGIHYGKAYSERQAEHEDDYEY